MSSGRTSSRSKAPSLGAGRSSSLSSGTAWPSIETQLRTFSIHVSSKSAGSQEIEMSMTSPAMAVPGPGEVTFSARPTPGAAVGGRCSSWRQVSAKYSICSGLPGSGPGDTGTLANATPPAANRQAAPSATPTQALPNARRITAPPALVPSFLPH